MVFVSFSIQNGKHRSHLLLVKCKYVLLFSAKKIPFSREFCSRFCKIFEELVLKFLSFVNWGMYWRNYLEGYESHFWLQCDVLKIRKRSMTSQLCNANLQRVLIKSSMHKIDVFCDCNKRSFTKKNYDSKVMS